MLVCVNERKLQEKASRECPEDCCYVANLLGLEKQTERNSSMEGRSKGSLRRNLTHISIIVFSDWSEQVLWTVGSIMLLRAPSPPEMLACNYKT